MQFSLGKQGQMSKRRQRPIADYDVAFFHFCLQGRSMSHVVRAHGRRFNTLQQSQTGMKQTQQMGNGKTPASAI